MTTPAERTRNLIQAGALLKDIRADQSLPERLRTEANRLLRHYPTSAEVQMLAQDSTMLTANLDPDWLGGNCFGAHK